MDDPVIIQHQYKNHSYGFGVPLVLGRLAAGTFSESESESLSSLESSDESSLVLVSGFFAGSSFELLA